MTKLAEQLQTLISDERWHHVSKRMEALEKFDKRVVEAFMIACPILLKRTQHWMLSHFHHWKMGMLMLL